MTAERLTSRGAQPAESPEEGTRLSTGTRAEGAAEAQQDLLRQVPLERIVPNARQPRRRFDTAQIAALARSIAAQGVLQPLLVRPQADAPGHYELVAGERRLRALKLLGWSEAPVHIREISDEHMLEAALVENLQREQLSPVEEAQAYQALLQQYGYTQESLAQRLGRDRSTIANTIRLLALPPSVQEDLEAGRLTPGHARALLAVADPRRQQALRRIILGRGLSVRETEALVGQEKLRVVTGPGEGDSARDRKVPPLARPLLHPRWRELQDRLERRYGTRIQIAPEPGAGGSILIEYSDGEDFNRIYDLLMGR
jgi:ParB family transcriptional regulator, chromosome partitioning protein